MVITTIPKVRQPLLEGTTGVGALTGGCSSLVIALFVSFVLNDSNLNQITVLCNICEGCVVGSGFTRYFF